MGELHPLAWLGHPGMGTGYASRRAPFRRYRRAHRSVAIRPQASEGSSMFDDICLDMAMDEAGFIESYVTGI